MIAKGVSITIATVYFVEDFNKRGIIGSNSDEDIIVD